MRESKDFEKSRNTASSWAFLDNEAIALCLKTDKLVKHNRPGRKSCWQLDRKVGREIKLSV